MLHKKNVTGCKCVRKPPNNRRFFCFQRKIMSKILFVVISASLVCALFYKLGRSHCRIETLVKEKEVIRYVERCKADIYSRPNASRSELLELMRRGELWLLPALSCCRPAGCSRTGKDSGRGPFSFLGVDRPHKQTSPGTGALPPKRNSKIALSVGMRGMRLFYSFNWLLSFSAYLDSENIISGRKTMKKVSFALVLVMFLFACAAITLWHG